MTNWWSTNHRRRQWLYEKFGVKCVHWFILLTVKKKKIAHRQTEDHPPLKVVGTKSGQKEENVLSITAVLLDHQSCFTHLLDRKRQTCRDRHVEKDR